MSAIKIFLSLSLIYFAALLYICIGWPKIDAHLWLNSWHNSFWDYTFGYATKLGEALPWLVATGLLFWRLGAARLIWLSLGLTALFSKLLKVAFIAPRPSQYFAIHAPDQPLPFVEGVEVFTIYSFPSGHTAIAFAFFCGLSFLAQDKKSGFFYFIFAALTGFSRIYLSQHFAEDVLAGGCLAVATTLLVYAFAGRPQGAWAQMSLPQLFHNRKS